MPDSSALVHPLEAVGLEAIDAVGGKNASLGEMLRALAAEGVRVPGGFALTASAYRLLLSRDGLGDRLETILSGLDANNLEQLQRVGLAARQLLLEASLPAELEAALLTAYRGLVGPGEEPAAVAVRSSATAEDLPEASFAGQQDTFLHIQGETQLLAATRRCYASLFTDRALSYRQHNGFGHLAVALSIGVQRMVLADRACSGVMFSLDTESGFRDTVLLSAAYGLGENVVQGVVNPDELLIFKPTLALGFDPILSRRLGSKEQRLVNQARRADAALSCTRSTAAKRCWRSSATN
jgi:pyruvate,water dikinase